MSKAENEHSCEIVTRNFSYPQQSLKEINFLVRDLNLQPQVETFYFKKAFDINRELRYVIDELESKQISTLQFDQISSRMGNMFVDDLERTNLLLQLVAEPNYESFSDKDLIPFAKSSCDQLIQYLQKATISVDEEVEKLKKLFHDPKASPEFKTEILNKIDQKLKTNKLEELCSKDPVFDNTFSRCQNNMLRMFRRRFGFVSWGFNREILDFNDREDKILQGFDDYVKKVIQETGRSDAEMIVIVTEIYKRFLVEFDTKFLEVLCQRKLELQNNQPPHELKIQIPQLLSSKMVVQLAEDDNILKSLGLGHVSF